MQHYHSSEYGVGPTPVYQGGVQQRQYQYKPPRPGPSRNRQSKRHETEAQDSQNQLHVSSGVISKDYSIGIHPANTWMGAFKNTRTRGAWRPPSFNPAMVNHDSTRAKPYKKDRAARSFQERTDKVHISTYQIPIMGPESKLI